jgi:methylmalonyl-CoA/ethylmalonyl-CoA epimerase
LIEHATSISPSASCLYFEVPDIHAACDALVTRGVALDAPAHRIHRDDAGTFGARGAEEWLAFFRDPDGHALALASRIVRRA